MLYDSIIVSLNVTNSYKLCESCCVQSNTDLLIKTSENLILIVGSRRKWLIIDKEYMWSS